MSELQAGQKITRRRFLDWILCGFGGIVGVSLAGPILVYLWPSTRKGPVQHRQEAGTADGWGKWASKIIAVGEKPVLVVRMSQRFRAYSAVCSHLGCLVIWHAAKRQFECPCHAAAFDMDGKVIAGPPPKPLVELAVSVVDGKVFVSG